MRILLVVPDGVGVRNYIYSSFIDKLEARGDEVIIYHQISNGAVDEIKSVQQNISVIRRIPNYTESYTARLLRESTTYGRILINKKRFDNETIVSFWTKKPANTKQKLLYTVSEIIGKQLSKSYNLLLNFEEKFRAEVSKNKVITEIEHDFLDIKPDYILSLHQRAPITAPIVEVAKILNIKCATVIFSWDNVPKARLVTKYDDYFVWSQLMKDELLLLYPEISSEKVIIVGTPQFEFYFKKEFQWSKEKFFAEYGLDCSKKTICFSANDLSSPYEAEYLADVCEQVSLIANGHRPQILFRKSPVDKSERFDAVLQKYKSLITTIDPDWKADSNSDNSFVNIFPSYFDLTVLVNTVLHSDLVINLGSTMAHDFAVYNKPCLYLNYDPVTDSTFKTEEVYNFQHFKSLKDIEAVVWLNSKAEITNVVLQVLENPEAFAIDKKVWMQRIAQYPLEDSATVLVKNIAL